MSTPPQTLDRAGIAARIPHRGAMCLLDALLAWSADAIDCRAVNQADPRNPLRLGDALPAACAVEYAAQAMALHGALCAGAGDAPKAGFLASARELRLHVARLDDVTGALRVQAQRLAGDSAQAIYRFAVSAADGRVLVDGRATVVLQAALAAPRA